MPLSEQRRSQLDGVVHQMLTNKEPDRNIRMVVEDFKQKYGSEGNGLPPGAGQQEPSTIEKIAGIVPNAAYAAGKFLTTSEQGLGNSLGDAMAVNSEDYQGAQQSQAGLDDMNVKLGHAIAIGKQQGKDTSRMEQIYKQNTGKGFDPSQIAPSINKTPMQIYGEGAGVAMDALTAGTYGEAAKGAQAGKLLSTAGKVGEKVVPQAAKTIGQKLLPTGVRALKGAGVGYGYDVSQKLQQGQGAKSFIPGVGTAVGALTPFATVLTGALTKRVVGGLSGAGTDVIEKALKNPDAVGEAITKYAKEPEAQQELVTQAESALADFAHSKSQEYGDKLSSLTEAKPIPQDLAKNSFKEAIKKFGGQVTENGNLTFKNTTLTDTDVNNLEKAWDKVNKWDDFSIQGHDGLRQAVGNYAKDFKIAGNPRANVVLGQVEKTIKNTLKSSVPGYGEMLSTYGNKSELAQQVLKEFQLGGSAKDSTKLKNVLKLFKKDPVALQSLEEVMGKQGSKDFQNEVAGAILSHWTSPGVLGNAIKASTEVLGAGGALLAGHPMAAGIAGTAMAASSPRIAGTIATTIGKGLAKGIGTASRRLLTKTASQIPPMSN